MERVNCMVVEDGWIGMAATKATCMVCIVTKSGYTKNEDFSKTDVVFPCMGDPPSHNFAISFCGNVLLDRRFA